MEMLLPQCDHYALHCIHACAMYIWIIKIISSWALVAHACNPRYSRGRDQEDQGLKPAWANSSQDPIMKTLHKNRAWRMAHGEGPDCKRSTTK
jgi:hypothetical protein